MHAETKIMIFYLLPKVSAQHQHKLQHFNTNSRILTFHTLNQIQSTSSIPRKEKKPFLRNPYSNCKKELRQNKTPMHKNQALRNYIKMRINSNIKNKGINYVHPKPNGVENIQ